MENISTTDSVFDRLVKILDTNCGYVDEEKAENVAKRLMRSGLIREEKPLVMINADRIRAMTDEELAKFIYEQADCFCVARYGVCIKDEDTCRAAWLKWLKEEVQE